VSRGLRVNKKFIQSIFVLILAFCFTTAHANLQGHYSFKVYLKDQIVKVFRDGVFLKKIPCSTGTKPGSTPTGKFKTYAQKEKDIWVEKDGTEISYYYITKFNNSVAFHSLLEGNHSFVDEGNKLFSDRKTSSMGCVRLKKEDAKWIYSLPLGASVEVI